MLISRIRKRTTIIIWTFLGIFLIFGVFFTYGVFAPGNRGQRQEESKSKVPDVILKVDGRSINKNLFEYKFVQFKQMYEAESGGRINTYTANLFLRAQVIDIFVSQEIYLHEAKKRGISADSAEVAKQVNIEKDRLVGPSGKFDSGGISDKLKQINAEKERDQEFRSIFARMGITYETFEESVRRDVIQRKVITAIGDEKAAMEKDAARKKAFEIIDKLKTGEPFENLAGQFTQDDSTREAGGDLGWIRRGTLFESFENAALALTPGEFTKEPVETPIGYHIIQLVEKKVAAGPDFEAQKQDIISSIREMKGDETYQPSTDEISREYEMIRTRHILIRTKTPQQIAQEWLKNEMTTGSHKIDIVNPELKAYRYLMRHIFDQSNPAEPDLDEAEKLYNEALRVDSGNQYLYYQLGTVYEQKYNKVKAEKEFEADPYEKAIVDNAEMDEPATGPFTVTVESATGTTADVKATAPEFKTPEKDPKVHLKEALEAFLHAKKIADEKYTYDPIILISVARIAQELGDEKLAIENYIEALDFSVGDKINLTQIRDGLSEYETEEAKKAFDEAESLLAEIESLESASEAAAEGEYTDEDESYEEDEYLEPVKDDYLKPEPPSALPEKTATGTIKYDEDEVPIETTPVAPKK